MNCPYCNTKLIYNDRKCPSCGAANIEEERNYDPFNSKINDKSYANDISSENRDVALMLFFAILILGFIFVIFY